MSKGAIVYSHGFGVRKDDRGLFKDIANALPNITHQMFDYNEFDDAANTLIARPLDVQSDLLRDQLLKAKDSQSVDIIAHSQGCIITALVNPEGIHRVIFLAPPAQVLGLEKKEIYASRPDTKTDEDGTLHMPRRDGSTTIIKDDYWKSRADINPIELYNALAEKTELIIISATKDEILTDTDFTGLSEKVKLIQVEANHDFTGDYRKKLIKLVEELVD